MRGVYWGSSGNAPSTLYGIPCKKSDNRGIMVTSSTLLYTRSVSFLFLCWRKTSNGKINQMVIGKEVGFLLRSFSYCHRLLFYCLKCPLIIKLCTETGSGKCLLQCQSEISLSSTFLALKIDPKYIYLLAK